MDSSSPRETHGPLPDTRPLEWAGFSLLTLFCLWSLLAILPPQVLNPVWGHQLVTNLVNNSPLLLLGVALNRLAVALNPRESARQAWRLRICRLAGLAALVYLLLIPLDVVATWRQVQGLRLQAAEREQAMDRRYREALKANEGASSTSSLMQNLRAFQAPELSPQDQNRPLADLKRELSASLETSLTSQKAQIRRATPATLFAMGREALRLLLSCLVCTLGLSALSWNDVTKQSQLESLAQSLQRRRFRQQARRQAEKRKAATRNPWVCR